MQVAGKQVAGAFVKACSLISATVAKDAKANYGKYATLAAIMEAIAQPLKDNGLALVQESEATADGVVVHTAVLHESGEAIHFAPLTMQPQQRTPQAVGSAITYARRYQLAAVFGIAPDDDDGQAASQPAKTTQNGRASASSVSEATIPPNAPQRAATPATEPTNDAAEVAQPWDSAEPIDPDPAPSPAPRGAPVAEVTLKRLHALGERLYGANWDAKRRELVEHVSHGATRSSKELTENEARRLCAGMEAKIAKLRQPDAALWGEAAA